MPSTLMRSELDAVELALDVSMRANAQLTLERREPLLRRQRVEPERILASPARTRSARLCGETAGERTRAGGSGDGLTPERRSAALDPRPGPAAGAVGALGGVAERRERVRWRGMGPLCLEESIASISRRRARRIASPGDRAGRSPAGAIGK
eukprot:scaffold22131_cov30-Tisochrysis_lutea.AAC.1